MPKIITLKAIGEDDIGYLSFFEADNEINFEIKRVYYIYEAPINTKRGMHAHKELKQFVWCPFGEVEIILDNGIEKKSYLLDEPNKGLIIERGFWRDMYWKKAGSVLCVAASDFYTVDDYIRNYDEFISLAEKGYWKNENQF